MKKIACIVAAIAITLAAVFAASSCAPVDMPFVHQIEAQADKR